MATESWIELRDGVLMLVEELDGAAYLNTRGAGKTYRWVTLTTIDALVRQYGEGSRLVLEARAVTG